MKYGVIAQRFGIPLFEALEASAEAGADGVQLYAASPRERLVDFTPAQRREVVSRCADLGLEIFSVCGEVGGFGFRETEKNPDKIDFTRRNIDLALELGCNIVTSHIGVVRTESESPLRNAQQTALREISAYARERNAFFAIETGPENAVILQDFLNELAAPNIGINLDPGNLVMVPGDDPVAAVHTFGSSILHTHIKDGIRHKPCDPEIIYRAFATGGIKSLIEKSGKFFSETPVGEGEVNWPAYMAALSETGFDGAMVIEREVACSSVTEIAQIIKFVKSQEKKNA